MAETYSLSVEESVALTRRITTLSVATALVLSILKAGVWLSSGSVSVLASLADSGLDLVAAFGTFVAVRYAAAPLRRPPCRHARRTRQAPTCRTFVGRQSQSA